MSLRPKGNVRLEVLIPVLTENELSRRIINLEVLGGLFYRHIAANDKENEFVLHLGSDTGVFSVTHSPLVARR